MARPEDCILGQKALSWSPEGQKAFEGTENVGTGLFYQEGPGQKAGERSPDQVQGERFLLESLCMDRRL